MASLKNLETNKAVDVKRLLVLASCVVTALVAVGCFAGFAISLFVQPSIMPLLAFSFFGVASAIVSSNALRLKESLDKESSLEQSHEDLVSLEDYTDQLRRMNNLLQEKDHEVRLEAESVALILGYQSFAGTSFDQDLFARWNGLNNKRERIKSFIEELSTKGGFSPLGSGD